MVERSDTQCITPTSHSDDPHPPAPTSGGIVPMDKDSATPERGAHMPPPAEPVARARHPDPCEIGVRAPVGVRTDRASIARVYDYSLGGKDNYEVDRAAYAQILEVAPQQGDVSKMNRRWLHRVVRFMVARGIEQFLDLGAGLPTKENTHEIAQEWGQEARVMYVDNDPMCSAHGRVLLEQNDNTRFVLADLTTPDELVGHPEIQEALDLDNPIGLLLVGILHHLDDSLDPAGIVRRYVEMLPVGSFVAISHFWDPGEGAELHDLAQELQTRFVERGLGSGWYRTREQIARYFAGLDLIEPGLVELEDWWPAGPAVRPRYPEEHLMLGGVGYKHPPRSV